MWLLGDESLFLPKPWATIEADSDSRWTPERERVTGNVDSYGVDAAKSLVTKSDLADKATLVPTPWSGDLSYLVSFIHFLYSVLNTAVFDPLLFAATRRAALSNYNVVNLRL